MAVRINKVYTRTGDRGETALVGGKRVPKDSPRIDAYGTIDELNSIVGLARVFNEESLDAGEAHRFLDGCCAGFRTSFSISAANSRRRRSFSSRACIGSATAKSLGSKSLWTSARKISNLSSRLFCRAAGAVGAYLHQCRTVCRRAEREILRLSRAEEINPNVIKYVNRLSDLFFVLSRWIAKQTGEQEYLWQRGLQKEKSKVKGKSVRLDPLDCQNLRERFPLRFGMTGNMLDQPIED